MERDLVEDRLQWNANGKKAFKATWNEESMECIWTKISLREAKELAKEVYKLPVPEHVSKNNLWLSFG